MIQVYTGNGKGKTTAALGLALRASGAGQKVYIGQFVKGRCYSEVRALEKISRITLEQCGRSCFINRNPAPADILCAQTGWERVKKVIASRKYQVIILDEILIALHFKLLDQSEVLKLLKKIPKKTEVILTGRYAPPEILKLADLTSEIKEVKHYYRKGIQARKGIEY